ncbi:MAG: GNAT family protein [Acidihalobacter sp.]|uniref:GNAT family protein n=1 Tax=Acidihalobacter sp. TaxID=1872108 RepID=UPI00307E9945
MELFLRKPKGDDYPVIASWIGDAVACARWAGPHVTYPFAAQDLPEVLDMQERRSRVLGSADISQPLGFGQFRTIREGEVHLGRIIVASGYRGRGLGKQMCRLLMQEATAETGVDVFTLRVYRDNPAARAVYMALGFQPFEAESDADLLFMRAIVPA